MERVLALEINLGSKLASLLDSFMTLNEIANLSELLFPYGKMRLLIFMSGSHKSQTTHVQSRS